MLLICTFGKEGCNLCEASRTKVNHLFDKYKYEDVAEYVFYDISKSVEALAYAAFLEAIVNIPHTFVWKDITIDDATEFNYIAKWEHKVPDGTLKKLLDTERENNAVNTGTLQTACG